jgi:hypothetical protein
VILLFWDNEIREFLQPCTIKTTRFNWMTTQLFSFTIIRLYVQTLILFWIVANFRNIDVRPKFEPSLKLCHCQINRWLYTLVYLLVKESKWSIIFYYNFKVLLLILGTNLLWPDNFKYELEDSPFFFSSLVFLRLQHRAYGEWIFSIFSLNFSEFSFFNH